MIKRNSEQVERLSGRRQAPRAEGGLRKAAGETRKPAEGEGVQQGLIQGAGGTKRQSKDPRC